ncbi:MAG TPA: hypothetical protein VJA22_03120 [Patescibacteria group bacterium]|nr:hypothetical protein [Patescibacteria group bacterium]
MSKFGVFEPGGTKPIMVCELTGSGEVVFSGADELLIKNLKESSLPGHGQSALTFRDGKDYFNLLPNHLLTMRLIVRELKD